MLHVWPVEDTRGHYTDTTCDCHPSVVIGDEILVAHNAFDRIDADGNFHDTPREAGYILMRGQGGAPEIVEE